MKPKKGRPLNTSKAVDIFLRDTLFYKDYPDDLASFIVNGEIGITALADTKDTLSFEDNRAAKYREDDARWGLRETVIKELITKKRLADDDKIELGNGGALPKTSVKNERKAFLLIGPPASGKSGLANAVADDYGAVIIDSDYAKRKLPEYKQDYGATLVHAESGEITYGFEKNPFQVKSLYELCVKKGHNLVIPTIGDNQSKLLSFAENLKNPHGYEAHLILVALSKRKATIRAALRSYKTRRYVPLSLIYDIWGNDPWLAYFYLRCKAPNFFKSFGAISTDVSMGEKSVRIDMHGDSPVAMFDNGEKEIEW
jgi:predicted kinase